MSTQVFTLVRTHDDSTSTECEIHVREVGSDSLKVGLNEDVEIGDVIEDRVNGLVKRMQILDVIPHRHGGFMAVWNDHLELRYELRSRATIDRPKHFDASSLHPQVAKIATERLDAGHGNDAVFRAFELIESRIQKLTGRTEIGDSLMTKVFQQNASDSLLDVAGDDLEEDRRDYERRGYRFIFMGATLGIRNTHAHGSRPEISPIEAFELLTLASHLMRRLDLAERRLDP